MFSSIVSYLNYSDDTYSAISARDRQLKCVTVSSLKTQSLLFTGSIARSASRRYLIYSEADFEVFRPAGATRCTDEGEIWHGGGHSSMTNFTPIGATTGV